MFRAAKLSTTVKKTKAPELTASSQWPFLTKAIEEAEARNAKIAAETWEQSIAECKSKIQERAVPGEGVVAADMSETVEGRPSSSTDELEFLVADTKLFHMELVRYSNRLTQVAPKALQDAQMLMAKSQESQ